ncbi:MAG: hypothetical protein JWM73_1304 [Solirubrobacterales bacterium]|jgi:hypothetical protein|nr:hypothetical protein [Solirubrobacterales bacterium]
MKKSLSAVALAGAALSLGLPAAADASLSHGRLRSFTNGQLTIFNASLGKSVYVVNGKTNCGVSFGQSGDQIPCKSLSSAKYDGKKVFVRWARNAANKRVATLVSVDMSGA